MNRLPLDPLQAADCYFRAACCLAAAHVFGMTWPPPSRPQRSKLVGHWGANPGIAWVVGHLAVHSSEQSPLLMLLGTGHATSFIVAHQALREQWSGDRMSAVTARYGQPNGDPAESIGWPAGLPYVGGELGPALAVSQAIALAATHRLVACIVGDGECETPAALAAFAHRAVLFGSRRVPWLPIVNANGARMGGPARFNVDALHHLFRGLGYNVLLSDADRGNAHEMAGRALASAIAGEPVVWISATSKGWPAPIRLNGQEFRGAAAHKPPTDLDPLDPETAHVLGAWLDRLANGLFCSDGAPRADLTNTARHVTFELDARELPSRTSSVAVPSMVISANSLCWRAPVSGADEIIAARSEIVTCPDEAISNRLRQTVASGRVVEILAEEVCAAWAIGSAEAGRPAVFATYEAFAPLAATQVAQYAKLVHRRPPRGTSPVIILLSSLSWANSPTHQNTDLVATIVARPLSRLRLLCPLSAISSITRLTGVFDELRDGLCVVACSKQPLLDLPDPGGNVVEISLVAGPQVESTIIVVGDVCVTEAIAAMTMAASVGIGLRVLAVVDVTALDPTRGPSRPLDLERMPTIGTVWCAPRFLEPLLWDACGDRFPVYGYREQWGPTPWETLCLNQMDRHSMLAHFGSARSSTLDHRNDEHLLSNQRIAPVPWFESPPLQIRNI